MRVHVCVHNKKLCLIDKSLLSDNYYRHCGLSEGECPPTNPISVQSSTLQAPGLCPLASPTKVDPFEAQGDRKNKRGFAMAATCTIPPTP